jgi:hypothetical protein
MPTRHHTTMKLLSGLLPQSVALAFLLLSLPCMGAKAMRVMYIAGGGTTLENCVLHDGTVSHKVDLPRRNLTETLPFPDGELVLRALPKPLASGEAVPPDAPRVTIPESWTRCILIFMSDPSNKVLPVKIIPVEASDTKMPLGHTLLFNCTQATIRGKFGNVVVTCKPGDSTDIKPPRQDSGDYDVAIDCFYPGETLVKPVCRSTWNHNPSVKQFLFATPDPHRKLPHIWGVNDLPEARKVNEGDLLQD